jgi:hypothetical protein
MPKPSTRAAGRRRRGVERTIQAVEQQMTAMGPDLFEVGAYKATAESDREPEMMLRTWDRQTLLASIPWLRYQNLHGRNIYIRPKGEHSLSLVDDLKSPAIERMKAEGFTPAIVIETSPGNFQAWLNHGRILPKDLSTATARALAERFGGDKGAADWRHFGRLAGFSNRKEKYRGEDGLYPFVRLHQATGQVYGQADNFVNTVKQKLEAEKIEAERRRRAVLEVRTMPAHLKNIEDFRQAPIYAGDGNRIDLAYAVYALSHGVPEQEVRAAIASRDLSHKGNERRQLDYVNRTIKKAYERIAGVARVR